MNELTKTCNKCGKELSLENFHKNRNGKYGRNGDCKECYNSMRREYNKRDKNLADKHRHWREKNQKENNVYYWNKRARKLNENAKNRYGLNDKVSGKEIMELYNSLKKCSYCDTPLKNSECHIDHVKPLANGGSNFIENLTISCPKCNTTKNNKDQSDFYEYVKTVYLKLKPMYERGQS